MRNKYKQVGAIVLICTFFLSAGCVFAAYESNQGDLDPFEPYSVYDWVDETFAKQRYTRIFEYAYQKNYITEKVKDDLTKRLNRYADLLISSYRRRHPEMSPEEFEAYSKSFAGTLKIYNRIQLYEDDEEVELYYRARHVYALLDLAILGLIDGEDTYFNLEQITLKRDAVQMVARLTGKSDELTEDLKTYVDFCEVNELFPEAINENGLNQPISLDELMYLYRRAFGYTVGEDGDVTFTKMYFGPEIYGRTGTYDFRNVNNKLHVGVPLRHSELISLSREYLLYPYKDGEETGLNALLKLGKISEERAAFFYELDYYNRFYNHLSDLNEFVHYYGVRYPHIYEKSQALLSYPYRTIRHIYASLYVDAEKCGIEKMISDATDILVNYGLTKSRAEEMINDSMDKGPYEENVYILEPIKGKEVRVFYNSWNKIIFIDFVKP